MASRNVAIIRAFTLPHVSKEDIAHIFDLKLCRVQNCAVVIPLCLRQPVDES